MSAPVQNGQPPATDERMTLAKFVAFLKSVKVREVIEAMLPKDQTFDRIVREVINAAAENPGIIDCEPGSIVRAISKAVTYDLVIGEGVFLVPRKDRYRDAVAKLRAQLGYIGKIELMLRYRAARFIDYHCIYANEHYRCEYGTNPFIEHKPIMDPAKRGALIGAYAFAQVTQHQVIIVEMHRDEIDAIRKKFSLQWKTETVWENGQKKEIELPLEKIAWFAEARVVHRLSKKVPMRGKLAEIMAEAGEDVNDDELEVEAGGVARRELGAGAAEPIVSHAGPGLETVPAERVRAADEAGPRGVAYEDFD